MYLCVFTCLYMFFECFLVSDFELETSERQLDLQGCEGTASPQSAKMRKFRGKAKGGTELDVKVSIITKFINL